MQHNEVCGQGYCKKHHISYQVLSGPEGGCALCKLDRDLPKLKRAMVKFKFKFKRKKSSSKSH